MFTFEENILKRMLQSYGRNEKEFEKDVETLRTWMKSQPHLPETLDKQGLRNFLLLNKCSVERAKEKIDNYYTVRCLIPEIFHKLDDEVMDKVSAAAYVVMLPRLTPDMCRTFLIKVRDKDKIKESVPLDIITYGVMLEEVRLGEDHMFKDLVIFDMDGITWEFLRKITPSILLKVITIYKKIFSMRLHSAHVINANPLINALLAIVKSMVKQKIFERIHVHEDSRVLHQLLPADDIPRDYGGHGYSCEELQRRQLLKLRQRKNRFEELDKMKVDESLRPAKLKNDDILGFYGNFKKLDID